MVFLKSHTFRKGFNGCMTIEVCLFTSFSRNDKIILRKGYVHKIKVSH